MLLLLLLLLLSSLLQLLLARLQSCSSGVFCRSSVSTSCWAASSSARRWASGERTSSSVAPSAVLSRRSMLPRRPARRAGDVADEPLPLPVAAIVVAAAAAAAAAADSRRCSCARSHASTAAETPLLSPPSFGCCARDGNGSGVVECVEEAGAAGEAAAIAPARACGEAVT